MVFSLPEVFHAVLGEVDVEAVEESSQKASYSPHHNEDDQVVSIPQVILPSANGKKTVNIPSEPYKVPVEYQLGMYIKPH